MRTQKVRTRQSGCSGQLSSKVQIDNVLTSVKRQSMKSQNKPNLKIIKSISPNIVKNTLKNRTLLKKAAMNKIVKQQVGRKDRLRQISSTCANKPIVDKFTRKSVVKKSCQNDDSKKNKNESKKCNAKQRNSINKNILYSTPNKKINNLNRKLKVPAETLKESKPSSINKELKNLEIVFKNFSDQNNTNQNVKTEISRVSIDDSKTSICEMVKTKSRNVASQSKYNRSQFITSKNVITQKGKSNYRESLTNMLKDKQTGKLTRKKKFIQNEKIFNNDTDNEIKIENSKIKKELINDEEGLPEKRKKTNAKLTLIKKQKSPKQIKKKIKFNLKEIITKSESLVQKVSKNSTMKKKSYKRKIINEKSSENNKKNNEVFSTDLCEKLKIEQLEKNLLIGNNKEEENNHICIHKIEHDIKEKECDIPEAKSLLEKGKIYVKSIDSLKNIVENSNQILTSELHTNTITDKLKEVAAKGSENPSSKITDFDSSLQQSAIIQSFVSQDVEGTRNKLSKKQQKTPLKQSVRKVVKKFQNLSRRDSAHKINDIYDFIESGNSNDDVKTIDEDNKSNLLYKRNKSSKNLKYINKIEINDNIDNKTSTMIKNENKTKEKPYLPKNSEISNTTERTRNSTLKPMVKNRKNNQECNESATQEYIKKKNNNFKSTSTKNSLNSENTNSDSSCNGTGKKIVSFKHSNKNTTHKYLKEEKRHRVASLNALAKVQCLYENESRTAQELGLMKTSANHQRTINCGMTENYEEINKKLEKQVAVTVRSLRNAPGSRGVGKHWEMDETSSSENNTSDESDTSYSKNKLEKRRMKKKRISKKPKPKIINKKQKRMTKESNVQKKKKHIFLKESLDSDNLQDGKLKQKKTDVAVDLIVRKRMASLNASAMMAASYEVERQMDRNSDSSSSENNYNNFPNSKKIRNKKNEEDTHEQIRPVSTNLVIVQDTDVTITGVYLNSSMGSSQEAYCKMQYRVQSSVTEERLMKPPNQEPQKSYTPLGALSSMRPPDSMAGSVQQSSPCESPINQYLLQSPYESGHSQPVLQHQAPPSSGASAFCAPLQHSDGSRYYQPAGPLITSNLLSQPTPGKSISTPLGSDSIQLQQPQQSSSAAESSDSEVLITGGDIAPRQSTFHYASQGPNPYSRSMHQLHCTYPPSYYPPYSQHPQDICYSPSYQPYFPPKIYPTSQPYRRYITGSYYQGPPSDIYSSSPPLSAPPPPSGSQIVSTRSAVPQHLEDYTGSSFYTGYSPNGHPQCYSHGIQPYMNTSPYTGSCPCSMQSCPKNVHTGPLIGSSKGPVRNIDNVSNTMTTTPPLKITCKIEDISPVSIKSEDDSHLCHFSHSLNLVPLNDCQSQQFEKLALAPLPNANYSVNTNLEPEMSISPARGSTGLPLPPTPASLSQPKNINVIRKARIGKNMVREKQMIAFVDKEKNNNITSDETSVLFSNNHSSEQQSKCQSQTIPILKHGNDIMKKEELKKEMNSNDYEQLNVDTFLSSEILLPSIKSTELTNIKVQEARNLEEINVSDNKKKYFAKVHSENNLLVIPSDNVKRNRIIETHNYKSEKSPSSSYKNLIKKTEPKPYLCTRNIFRYTGRRKCCKIVSKLSKRNISNSIRKTISRSKKTKVLLEAKQNKIICPENNCDEQVIFLNNTIQDNEIKRKGKGHIRIHSKDTNVDHTIDMVAKGYFSDSEIRCTKLSSQKKFLKLKDNDNRSKSSESVRNKNKNKSVEKQIRRLQPRDLNYTAATYKTGTICDTQLEEKQKLKTTSSKLLDNDRGTIKLVTKTNNKKINGTPNMHKISISKIKTNKLSNEKSEIESPSLFNYVDNSSTIVINSMLKDPMKNNNNNILVDNNNKSIQMIQSMNAKRTKSRASKFSCKKKHKRTVKEVEEVLFTRKNINAPRWSNGWSWEGKPFQGKVFLNSDDPPVVRTCYPAMKHEEGDIIKPRDCVLLRAGTKRAELPYVAKVAYLWENPEDGEMMMSLLWYYRPEHTEQGRQPLDCYDEVFASRHKDHNSVACIEDKCFVLTFNEYCRYRRQLKSFEENITVPPSIVPPLTTENPRYISPTTSSELVMFCRRVYEFRLKRMRSSY